MEKSARSKREYPDDVDSLVRIENLPVVAINQDGLFTFINKAFERAYGWQSDELLKMPVSVIIPPYLRDAHKIGFARFLMTEESTLLGQRLDLKILCKSGDIETSEHYIIGDKSDGTWRFAAIIKPVSK